MDNQNNNNSTILLIALGVAFMIALCGNAMNLWTFGFNSSAAVGLIAVIPASIWVYFKGLNYVNSAVYFAGIAFIMYKNLFGEITGRFVILCILLCVFAVLLPATASLFKKENTAEKSQNVKKGKE